MSDITASKSISQLSAAQAVSDSDIIPITQNVSGSLVTNGVTMAQVMVYVIKVLQDAGLIGG